MSDLVKRLRDTCSGHPHAKIAWPHRIIHEAADRIEQLERELAEIKRANIYMDAQHQECRNQLATEKALADRLYEAARNYRVSAFWARDKSFIDAHATYRKARGM